MSLDGITYANKSQILKIQLWRKGMCVCWGGGVVFIFSNTLLRHIWKYWILYSGEITCFCLKSENRCPEPGTHLHTLLHVFEHKCFWNTVVLLVSGRSYVMCSISLENLIFNMCFQITCLFPLASLSFHSLCFVCLLLRAQKSLVMQKFQYDSNKVHVHYLNFSVYFIMMKCG